MFQQHGLRPGSEASPVVIVLAVWWATHAGMRVEKRNSFLRCTYLAKSPSQEASCDSSASWRAFRGIVICDVRINGQRDTLATGRSEGASLPSSFDH